MNFIVGANGRLGKKLASAFSDNVICMERALYENWWRDNSIDDIAYYFERVGDRNPSTLYIASGILDPSRAIEEHNRINYLLPINLIQGAAKVGIRTITFGTVMEQWDNNTVNPYVASKIRLSNFVRQFSRGEVSPLHIRMHTLYGGGPPNAFMFLGQMLKSIKTKTVFKMSSGEQLREYHHIDDDIMAILSLQDSGKSGLIHLSHGKPLSLKEIATHVFGAFQCSELLDIGALPQPYKEHKDIFFRRTSSLGFIPFRESLSGIVAYFRHYAKDENE